ncbi:MAG: thioredoxin [Paludibacter sp.]|nr:thioredoxin [Paludibacter sp.]
MQTSLIILAIVLGVLVVLNIIARSKMKALPKVADNEKVLTLTAENFDEQTKERIILVDFWAEWCAPCRMMAPVLNNVANELTDDKFIGKVDVEEHQVLAQRFNVRSIPTLILFKDGKEVERFVGVKSKDYLLNAMK